MDWIIDFFNFRAMFHGFLLPELIYYGVIILLSLSLIRSFYLALSEGRYQKEVIETVWVICAACEWEGEVPRLRKVCPKCGQSNFVS